MNKLLISRKIDHSKEDIRHYLANAYSVLRLTPPWQDIRDYSRDGTTHMYKMKHWCSFFQIVSRRVIHVEDNAVKMTDSFMESPFPVFQHEKLIENATQSGTSSIMKDMITYTPPCGIIGEFLNPYHITKSLNRLMHFQQERTLRDMPLMKEIEKPQSILLTGSNGFIGRHLHSFLGALGHYVTPLVRNVNKHNHPTWNPDTEELNTSTFEDVDTVVHLAGESLFNKRWSAEQKEYILENRLKAAATLANKIAEAEHKPKTLIIASAIGFYGNCGDTELTEESPAGEDFAADICTAMENAVKPAKEAGVRVIILRLGIVLNPRGGALAQMLTPFKMGVGGPVGNGKQYMSWVGLEDVLRVFHFCLNNHHLEGVFNVTAPEPVTNNVFSKALGRVLKRPAFLRMPKFVIKMMFGEMGEVLLLSSAKVLPKRLENEGFSFLTPTLKDALKLEILGIYPDDNKNGDSKK